MFRQKKQRVKEGWMYIMGMTDGNILRILWNMFVFFKVYLFLYLDIWFEVYI